MPIKYRSFRHGDPIEQPWKPLAVQAAAPEPAATSSFTVALNRIVARVFEVVADAIPAAVVTLAAAVPPPRPQLPPSDWVCVLSREGVIIDLTNPMPMIEAQSYREKIITAGQGHVAVTIVHRSVAAGLRKGMSPGAMLDILESQLARAYQIYLDPDERFRF
jgi:hypothetical protein